MSSQVGATQQDLAQIAALIDAGRVDSADQLLTRLIRSSGREALILMSPDLRTQIHRFLPKRQRRLSALLDSSLSEKAAAELPVSPPTANRGVQTTPLESAEVRYSRYVEYLNDLRDHHIFQWGTFYRDKVGHIYKDLYNTLAGKDGVQQELDSVSDAFSNHAREIYTRGAGFLSTAGFSEDVAQIKSLNGLQRLLYLIINLYLENRDSVTTARQARLIWGVTSSLITGVLRGYGHAMIGRLPGWKLLRDNSFAWLPSFGFVTGSDAIALLQEFPAECQQTGIFATVGSSLVALEKLSNKYHGNDVFLPRLSRVAPGFPPRLDLTLTVTVEGAVHDVNVSCFYDAPISELRSLDDALKIRASAVIVRLSSFAKTHAEQLNSTNLIDASAVKVSPQHAHNLAEQVSAVLEESTLADTKGAGDSRLTRNYARDFPLEDPEFRRLFMVERHSVKSLLEQFERGTGIHLWCSVRRSGKTTAAASMADMTGRSIVLVQSMDHLPHQPEANILERRIREALTSRAPIATDFFSNVVKECVLSTLSVQTDQRKIVLVIDEYESLFGLIAALTATDPDLRFLVAQPLLSQMVSYATKNLLILMGQRPDAHFILASQNQLSPLVRQDTFPLFEHFEGGVDTEFGQFVRRVLTDKMVFTTSFVDAVFEETSGHPYLTVNALVDLCDWMINNEAEEAETQLDAARFIAFAKDRLSPASLQRSPFYTFFQSMLAEYMSERSRTQEPWLHAVASVLHFIGRKHPRAFACPILSFHQYAEALAKNARVTPDQLLSSAVMANFLRMSGGQVAPAVRLMGRLAASVVPEAE